MRDPPATASRFAITAGSNRWKTIKPASALPVITEPLVIDGTTQAGATVNTAATGTNARMRILLDGPRRRQRARAPGDGDGDHQGPRRSAGFARGIQLSGGADGSRIVGDFIGTDRTGTARPRQHRQRHPRQRRGTCASAPSPALTATSSRAMAARASASASRRRSATIQGSLIGTKRDGQSALANSGDGVFVTGSSRHLIGGDDHAARATSSAPTTAMASTSSRSHSPSLDLVPHVGPDPGQLHQPQRRAWASTWAAMASRPTTRCPTRTPAPTVSRTSPAVASAVVGTSNTTIKGTLSSRRERAYRIELFQSDAGDPEGRAYLGSVVVAHRLQRQGVLDVQARRTAGARHHHHGHRDGRPSVSRRPSSARHGRSPTPRRRSALRCLRSPGTPPGLHP